MISKLEHWYADVPIPGTDIFQLREYVPLPIIAAFKLSSPRNHHNRNACTAVDYSHHPPPAYMISTMLTIIHADARLGSVRFGNGLASRGHQGQPPLRPVL